MQELTGTIIFSCFPFLIVFYFFHFYKTEKRKNLMDFLNDLTDYIFYNENLYFNELEEEELVKEKEESIKEKVKEDLFKPEIKYEEKYIDLFYINNNDADLLPEEESEKESFFLLEKNKFEMNLESINNEIDCCYNKMELCYDQNDKKEIQKKIVLLGKQKVEYTYSEDKIKEIVLKNFYFKRLEKLKNSFIMEKTPLGNVVMYYNVNRESFEFFSDNTIPYRFLEVVARKYVITFKCRFIYIMMEEELKKYEKKMEFLEIQKKIQEEATLKTNSSINPKKNVFATFKSYNKESGSGRVLKAPPPKNSIPNNKIYSKNNNEKIILKENSNRYTYEGRFSNFSPLKKIERKQIDKKYSISFADYKKLHLQL